eukprot:1146630-Pelagomonas_calceolata.AAC.2
MSACPTTISTLSLVVPDKQCLCDPEYLFSGILSFGAGCLSPWFLLYCSAHVIESVSLAFADYCLSLHGFFCMSDFACFGGYRWGVVAAGPQQHLYIIHSSCVHHHEP